MTLRINVLGGLNVEREGLPVAGAAAQPRRVAILALLARADTRGVTRARLMSLLWPDVDEDRARRSLTQAIYALRHDLGDEEAILGIQDLRLDFDLVDVNGTAVFYLVQRPITLIAQGVQPPASRQLATLDGLAAWIWPIEHSVTARPGRH